MSTGLNIGDWASLISLAIQMWGAATGKLGEADRAKEAFSEILGGDEEALLEEALSRWKENLDGKISLADSAAVLQFTRTQLSLAEPFRVEIHDHWGRLYSMCQAVATSFKQMLVFDLRSENGLLLMPSTLRAFWPFLKDEVEGRLRTTKDHEKTFAGTSQHKVFLREDQGPGRGEQDDSRLPLLLFFRVEYDCSDCTGYGGWKETRSGFLSFHPGPKPNRLRFAMELVAPPEIRSARRFPSLSDSVAVQFDARVSAGTVQAVLDGLEQDVHSIVSALRDEERLLESEIDPRIRKLLEKLSGRG